MTPRPVLRLLSVVWRVNLLSCWFLQTRREVGSGRGGAGKDMAGSGEANSSAEEVISHDFFCEFSTCRERIKNSDCSSDVLPYRFPVGVRKRKTHCIWLLPCFSRLSSFMWLLPCPFALAISIFSCTTFLLQKLELLNY
jgi:hypothetical protein